MTRQGLMFRLGSAMSFGLVAAVLMIAPALAQQSGGVAVRGNTNVNVNAENVTTMAVGQGNVAKTRIGTVGAGGGGSNVTVDAKNVQNVVSGRGRKGCINIGTSGTDPDCR